MAFREDVVFLVLQEGHCAWFPGFSGSQNEVVWRKLQEQVLVYYKHLIINLCIIFSTRRWPFNFPSSPLAFTILFPCSLWRCIGCFSHLYLTQVQSVLDRVGRKRSDISERIWLRPQPYIDFRTKKFTDVVYVCLFSPQRGVWWNVIPTKIPTMQESLIKEWVFYN